MWIINIVCFHSPVYSICGPFIQLDINPLLPGGLFISPPLSTYHFKVHTWNSDSSAYLPRSFMVLASLFSLYKVYHTITFEFSIYKDGTVQPISLGNPDSDVTARREPVSISA